MPWDLCIRQSSSLALQMPQLFNLLFLWKDLFHIEKEPQGCIRLYHLHLLRYFFRYNVPLAHEIAGFRKLTNVLSYNICRLWLSFHTSSHRLWYTLQYSIPWVPLSGLLIGSFGTYSSCILLCYISPSMGWWLRLSHQIITLLPSLLLHFICCGTFSAVLWFLIRYGKWCFIASI